MYLTTSTSNDVHARSLVVVCQFFDFHTSEVTWSSVLVKSHAQSFELYNHSLISELHNYTIRLWKTSKLKDFIEED